MLQLVLGDREAVFDHIRETVDNRQQIVFAGITRDTDEPTAQVLVLALDSGQLALDKGEIPKDLIADLQADKNVDFVNFVHDDGQGRYFLNGESGFRENPNALAFEIGLSQLTHDDDGFVIGDPNRDRTLLMIAPDTDRVTYVARKGGRAIQFGSAFPGQKVRHAIIGDTYVEALEGGRTFAVTTINDIDAMFDGENREWKMLELDDKLEGKIEDVSLAIGTNTFLATLAGGKKRIVPITFTTVDDILALTTDFKNAINVDDLDPHLGGLVRYSPRDGAIFVDRNGGPNVLTFRNPTTLPKGFQKIADMYAPT